MLHIFLFIHFEELLWFLKMVFLWWVSMRQHQRKIILDNSLIFKIHKVETDGTDTSTVRDSDFSHRLMKVQAENGKWKIGQIWKTLLTNLMLHILWLLSMHKIFISSERMSIGPHWRTEPYKPCSVNQKKNSLNFKHKKFKNMYRTVFRKEILYL